MNIKKPFKILEEIFFPRQFTCDICGVETFNTNLCADCKKTVIFNGKAVCPVCGRRTVRPEICLECKEKPPLFKRAVSAIVYEDGGVILVKKFKSGSAYLKEFFADILEEKLRAFPPFDCIAFVPMTKKAERKRGYNQSRLLAKALAKRLNVPVLDALEKVKATNEQKALTQRQRAENLKNCFKVKDAEAVKGKIILLADDVLTTGTTAETVSQKLLSAGAKAVYLATVASVEFKIIKEENASEL